jgi:hypothetical protein
MLFSADASPTYLLKHLKYVAELLTSDFNKFYFRRESNSNIELDHLIIEERLRRACHGIG